MFNCFCCQTSLEHDTSQNNPYLELIPIRDIQDISMNLLANVCRAMKQVWSDTSQNNPYLELIAIRDIQDISMNLLANVSRAMKVKAAHMIYWNILHLSHQTCVG